MRTVLTALALVATASSAHAALTTFGSVGGAPTGVSRESFDALPLGTAGGTLASGITVAFTPAAQAVQGALGGQYAAPFLSGGNGAGFGSPNQPNGADTTTYLTSGSTTSAAGAGVELSFDAPQRYLGLLWGSVDAFNTLTFFDGVTMVGVLTGADVSMSPNGNQGVQGTLYVNINSTLDFDRVVATSSQFAFEFDNVAFNETQVPAPATLALFGLGLAGLAAARRR